MKDNLSWDRYFLNISHVCQTCIKQSVSHFQRVTVQYRFDCMKYYDSLHRVIMPKYGVLPSAQMEILWWVFHYKKRLAATHRGRHGFGWLSFYLYEAPTRSINPWSPIINTILHTFRMALLERICSNIKTFHLWWSFRSFSWRVCLIRQCCCQEKLDADHYWGLKG